MRERRHPVCRKWFSRGVPSMGTQHSTSGRCRLDNEGDRRGMMPSDLDGCVRSRRSLSLVRLPAEEISTTFETRCRRAKKSIPRTSVSSLGGEGFRLKVSLPVPALPLIPPPPHTLDTFCGCVQVLSVCGIGMLVFQLLVYPWLSKRIGVTRSQRYACLLSMPVFLAFPSLSLLRDSGAALVAASLVLLILVNIVSNVVGDICVLVNIACCSAANRFRHALHFVARR